MPNPFPEYCCLIWILSNWNKFYSQKHASVLLLFILLYSRAQKIERSQMLPISSSLFFVSKNSFNMADNDHHWPLLAHFGRKIAQLCLWNKIRTKQWLVSGASAFRCTGSGFLCPKCDNFGCLHTRHDQNELHLKRWFHMPKSASSVSRSVGIFPSVVQAYTQPYSFGGRIKLIICQIRHELCVTIHEISTSWTKTLDGRPYINRNK